MHPSADHLWAITTYFNPLNYRRKLANYRLFRKRLNAPLLTVELAYGSEFELADGDADILVRLCGRDILWQKERLLNVALRHLPSACQKIASVDCDVIFESEDWGERVSGLLDSVKLVQPFRDVHRMGRDWVPGPSVTEPQLSRPSAAFAVASGIAPAICIANPAPAGLSIAAPGFAWAGHRELFEACGFYDVCIIGGAVSALACAAYGCFDNVMRIHCMNERQKERYLAWARPFHEAVRADTAFLDCNLFHLWHGEFDQRRYLERHQGLSAFDFDPFADIAIENDVWRWNTDKPAMHAYVRDYLASRKEDG